MAMLAERKRKQRWSLNPRGKHWSDDVNKFGQKMLEKMGWTAGKGLGANEDGMTEHVKINYKNDSKGMGFKENGEQWTKHENDFSSLLDSLGGSDSADGKSLVKPDKSLEQKSRSSRARVHYHKFTRGKDLSLRSEKDLANIFGRKTLERSVETEEQPVPEPESSESKEFGVTTVAAGSMADYFKAKLSKLSNTFSSDNKNDDSESESEIGRCAGFGFSAQSTNQFMDFTSPDSNCDQNGAGQTENVVPEEEEEKNDEQNSNEDQKSDKKRKRKLEKEEDDAQLETTTKKMKKKKKKNLAFDNAGLEVNVDEEVCYDNPCLEDLSNSVDRTSEPEMKNTSNAFVNLGFNLTDEQSTKRKKKVTFASSELANDVKKSSDEHLEEEIPKKSKKKKKNPEAKGLDNPACEVLDFDDSCHNEEAQINIGKISKKKNKAREECTSDVDCAMTNGETLEVVHNDDEIQKKSKKKSKKRQNETDSVEDEIEGPKKSKKKAKKLDSGIDNLACVVNTVEEGVASINNAIDNYQNELENEINERKADMCYRPPSRKFANRFEDRKSLKHLVTPGQLRLNFSGANLNKIPGYGVEI